MASERHEGKIEILGKRKGKYKGEVFYMQIITTDKSN